jgi:hypothetical protein
MSNIGAASHAAVPVSNARAAARAAERTRGAWLPNEPHYNRR